MKQVTFRRKSLEDLPVGAEKEIMERRGRVRVQKRRQSPVWKGEYADTEDGTTKRKGFSEDREKAGKGIEGQCMATPLRQGQKKAKKPGMFEPR